MILVQIPENVADQRTGSLTVAAGEITAKQWLFLGDPLRMGRKAMQREFGNLLRSRQGSRGNAEGADDSKSARR